MKSALLSAALLAPLAVSAGEIDLRPQWDEARPLANPDKGWYHHLIDNHVNKYRLASDDDLLIFPGMDHIYLRLAWAYLEPREGRFDWNVVDEPIAKWTVRGLGVAFRITCRETGADRIEQQFATPRWVREAGAQGGFFLKGKAVGEDGPWEPVYDDPVFLAKLDRFLAAFAARYDGKPWLRYVDIGSVGDWGEGHTFAGSQRKYGIEALERHVDMHVRYFRRTPLVISDDYVSSLASAEDRRRLHAKLVRNGVSYRDDSILVDWYVKTHSANASVRSPDLFADVWSNRPTVLELEHYGTVKRSGNWTPQPGSSLEQVGGGRTGADYFRGALEKLHATYIGYHGYAHEWLADNPTLTVELLNRCGYWFFPHRAGIPDSMAIGKTNTVTIWWQNRGVAPAYRAYDLLLRLEGPETYEQRVPSGNTSWLPGPTDQLWRDDYALALPATLRPGDYTLKFKLHAPEAGRDVKLPLKKGLLDSDGFYRIGTTRVATP